MTKNKESSLDKRSENPTIKSNYEYPDNRYPNSDDHFEETETPVNLTPVTVRPYHPHFEEITDGTLN